MNLSGTFFVYINGIAAPMSTGEHSPIEPNGHSSMTRALEIWKSGAPLPQTRTMEIVRQWIRENYEDDVDADIDWPLTETFKYSRDLVKASPLDSNGFVNMRNRYSIGHTRWNPSTGEYAETMDLDDYESLFRTFYGAGLGAQLASLEMRLLTPDFKSPAYTTIKSFYDEPVVLPYGLLGKYIESPTLSADESQSYGDIHLWTAGPITATGSEWYPSRLTLTCQDRQIDYDDYPAYIHSETYENGAVLHITPYVRDGFAHGHNRFATIMFIKK